MRLHSKTAQSTPACAGSIHTLHTALICQVRNSSHPWRQQLIIRYHIAYHTPDHPDIPSPNAPTYTCVKSRPHETTPLTTCWINWSRYTQTTRHSILNHSLLKVPCCSTPLAALIAYIPQCSLHYLFSFSIYSLVLRIFSRCRKALVHRIFWLFLLPPPLDSYIFSKTS